MSRIEFHPEALLELEAAEAWYRERDLLLASTFGAEIIRAITQSQTIPIGFQGLAVMNTD